MWLTNLIEYWRAKETVIEYSAFDVVHINFNKAFDKFTYGWLTRKSKYPGDQKESGLNIDPIDQILGQWQEAKDNCLTGIFTAGNILQKETHRVKWSTGVTVWRELRSRGLCTQLLVAI